MTRQPAWVDEVLSFWFLELEKPQWFKKDDSLDADIRRRFDSVHSEVSASDLGELTTSPHTALAAIIVLDQFSRNMFRGSKKTFASDPIALDLAKRVLQKELERGYSVDQKAFCYLPFEHSEAIEDQHRSVALFQALGDANYLAYAKAHLEVIEKFGRFPHRNELLSRISTPQELKYLAQPGSGF